MKGILRVAFKLLVNDWGKFAALIVGVTFAVFLMVQLTSVFSGILNKASATIINVGASVWVMDPAVNNPLNSIQLPDYILDAVRSINGVKYAVPLYSGVALVKLHAHPQRAHVPKRQDGRSGGDGLAGAKVPAQHDTRDRSGDDSLLQQGPCLGEMRLREPHLGFGAGTVFGRAAASTKAW